MIGGRIISVALAAIILLLSGGDCVPLVFADKETRDCCTRGHCGPGKSNPCCKISSAAAVQQFQPEVKFSVPELALAGLAEAFDLSDLRVGYGQWLRAHLDSPVHSPPGLSAETPLPLLI